MALGQDSRRMSQRGERRTARDLRGRVQPASGALPFHKGDVLTPLWLVERKDTTSKQYVLHLPTWTKLEHEAHAQDRSPLFVVGFATGQEFVIMPMSTFRFLNPTFEGDNGV